MAPTTTSFAAIDDALADVAAGKFVVLVDTEGDGSGVLTIAADFTTPEAVNFILSYARGPLYLCLSHARCSQLGLSTIGSPLRSGATFTVLIEAKGGTDSSMSGHDRARTVRLAADPSSEPADFVYPGNLPVLRARPGGILERARDTEAVVDLARLAGLNPAGAISLVLTEDGNIATGAKLFAFGERHGIKLVGIGDLVLHRRRTERIVERTVSVRMPTPHGEFRAVAFRDMLSDMHHVALVKGDIDGADDVLVRVHTQCLLGDVFHSKDCDCAESLDAALTRIESEGRGVVLYLSRRARGLGWLLRQTAEDGPRPAEELTDIRDWGVGIQILVELGIRRVRILTDTVRNVSGLELYGLTVVEQVPLRDGSGPPRREHHQQLPLNDAVD